jgi:two-component sensor histidine kinase
VPEGKITIEWRQTADDDRQVDLQWTERQGPRVGPRSRVGFGSSLIEQGFAAQLNGKAELVFRETGLVCNLECPLN